MENQNDIIILKLGGSLITDKDKPLSLRMDIIQNAIDQVINSRQKLIIVHGGGSFGHPLAKKYGLVNGYNPDIENQNLGIAETHDAMVKLNSQIINQFLQKNFPVISVQPSSIFIKSGSDIWLRSIEQIELALDNDILPILYGDIIFDNQFSFSILSGDRIIRDLCRKLRKYNVSKVIFTMEEDGILITEDPKNPNIIRLLEKINNNEITSLNLANINGKIDVTGGIRGKLNDIKQICSLGVPAQIINGLIENNILKALKNEQVRGTLITPSDEFKTPEISTRKVEHLKIPLEHDVQHRENYFKYIKFIHHAKPDFDLEEIDISTIFFGKKISAPICISAITGGHPLSKELNEILAKAAESEQIIMSVGSQRAALEDPSLGGTFSIVRKVAPFIPIVGNIGVGQISETDFSTEQFKQCIEMIDADVMAIHFNPLHELIQAGGDISYTGFNENFSKIRKNFSLPIMAKEVGSGFSAEVISEFETLGFDAYDVGGAGGTSFASIESYRNKGRNDPVLNNLARDFREWGIPTPISILNARKITKKPLIATGGLRNGIDIAKSIVLGADVGGLAYRFLVSAWEDHKLGTFSKTIDQIKTLKKELKSTLWLLNLKSLPELKQNEDKRTLIGPLYQWINQ